MSKSNGLKTYSQVKQHQPTSKKSHVGSPSGAFLGFLLDHSVIKVAT